MTCRGCGHHFCWSCGRGWAQHSAETGGYYHCALQAAAGGGGGGEEELAEYALGGGGGGGLPGPLAWVAGVWGSVRAAAAQHALQRQLRQYLRYSGGAAHLAAAAAHMRLLLRAAGMLAPSEPPAGAAGPQLLGVSAAEASRMSSREWGDLVAAAAASAADAAGGAQPAALAVPAARACAKAALASAAACAGGGDADDGAAYLERLAAALAAARGLLQHAAVAAHLLPSGPARRHLQQLGAALQRRLGQLEPLLMALPEREAAAGHHPYPALTPAHPPRSSGACAASAGGGGGLAGWLLARLYGVEAPPAMVPDAPEAHPALAALPGDVLLQQLHFAAAVHEQRRAVQAGVAALERDMREMAAAGRAGVYA
jgi:hypothetical protein